MNCDVGEVTERLENGQSSYRVIMGGSPSDLIEVLVT